MNKILILSIIFFLSNCSFDTRSGIWTEDKKVKRINKNVIQIFKNKEKFLKEFNSNLVIKLSKSFENKNYDLTNNSGISNFKTNIKKSSRFKFSKIENFNYFEPDLISDGKNFIFFDDKSNLLKFGENFKTVWKKNYYTKNEKKLKPILTLSVFKNNLVVTDSIGKIYNVNLKTGNLIWEKKNLNPFNSELKIYKDKIFAIDMNNILRCFSLQNGEELWNFVSENTFLKSNKRNSLVIKNDVLFFNNSLGDITAVNTNKGSLLWQIPTQSSNIYENAFSLKTSDLVINDENLFFSNNKNEFFSFSLTNGVLNWKQDINASIRPVIIDNFIFTVSNEGFLFVIDKKSGNIIRITDLFEIFKNDKRQKIIPVGFISSEKEILLSTSNGRLLIIDIKTGKTKSLLRIDNNQISRPFIFNKQVLLVKDNSIIRLN